MGVFFLISGLVGILGTTVPWARRRWIREGNRRTTLFASVFLLIEAIIILAFA